MILIELVSWMLLPGYFNALWFYDKQATQEVAYAKYVDGTSAFYIIPRNSIIMLDVLVREIHEYCMEHKMKLNPKNCKEMNVNFMNNSITTMRPINVGNQEVEWVKPDQKILKTLQQWKGKREQMTFHF